MNDHRIVLKWTITFKVQLVFSLSTTFHITAYVSSEWLVIVHFILFTNWHNLIFQSPQSD